MIEWSANPIAFSAGVLQIRWYGLVYAAGFLLAYSILYFAAKRKIIKNLTEELADSYTLLLMLGSILGARITYVIVYNPIFYIHNPLEIPAVWHGGLSIHGGLLGAALITGYFCKKYDISFYNIADILILPLALILVFGRMANYANAELYGRITNSTQTPWCVNFPTAQGCRHPSQLYEALYSYLLFIILLVMSEVRKWKEGTIFWTFITLYGTFRFITTFYREFDPTDPAYLSLSLGQWLSIMMVLAGIAWFFWPHANATTTTKRARRSKT